MSRTSHRLTVSLSLVLICLAASALQAAPAPASAAAFLETLSAEAPCRAAQIDVSGAAEALQPNAPVNRVIYPDCGFNCSDSACSGATNGDTCYPSGGGQGTCTPHNTFCSGEFHRSPCTCDHVTTCIPPGGTDDVLYNTDCCSGQAVPGSTWCDNPADYGTTWASCHQICA
jgi:hypothetical protein